MARRRFVRDLRAVGVMVAPARPPYRELLSGRVGAVAALVSVAGFAHDHRGEAPTAAKARAPHAVERRTLSAVAERAEMAACGA